MLQHVFVCGLQNSRLQKDLARAKQLQGYSDGSDDGVGGEGRGSDDEGAGADQRQQQRSRQAGKAGGKARRQPRRTHDTSLDLDDYYAELDELRRQRQASAAAGTASANAATAAAAAAASVQQVASLQARVDELQAQLATANFKAQGREAQARKYKEAAKALKVGDLPGARGQPQRQPNAQRMHGYGRPCL